MKLTEENVRIVMMKLLGTSGIWECSLTDREAMQLAFYNAGVFDMAEAIIEAIREVQK